MRLQRSLTAVSLLFVMYFNVSGGAFSTEGLVAQAGPGLALAILVLIPICWALPETLIVAELASMLPEEGGYYRWVKRAFGAFWAFQNGWWTWMYSLVDMAIYPVLFNQYLSFLVPGLTSLERWAIALAVIWGATAINLRGAMRVGRVSIVAGVFVLAAFASLSVAAVPHMTHAPWVPFTTGDGVTLGGLGVALSIALWNYIGWDNASTVQGEVVDATRSYPRALALALPLVTLSYLVPLLATLSATDWTQWREGGWPDIALAAAGQFGPALAVWLALAGMVSAVALFNALLLAYSRIPLAMAADGMLPQAFARTDARGTPRQAILFAATCYSLFALLPFGSLVVADVLLYAMALMLEFGALIHLRRREPGLRGAFRIPLGRTGVMWLASVPALVLLLVVTLELQDPEYGAPAVGIALGAALLGPVVYRVLARGADVPSSGPG